LFCLIEYFDFFRRDVSRCFLLSEAFSIQFQWIFLSKNSLKPLELTFLICIYRQVFKPTKKLTLSCFVSSSISTFFVGMYRDVSCYLKRSRYNFNDFLSKNSLKPLEQTFLICIYRQILKLQQILQRNTTADIRISLRECHSGLLNS
jgi:hypothetical protein